MRSLSSLKMKIRSNSISCLFLGTTNNFVDVIVDLPLSAFVCKFSDHEANTPKTCTVSYGPGESCDDLSRSGQAAATSESVLVHLPALAQDSGSRYCYVVTASNGSFTAKVTGTFNTGIVALNL